MYYVDIDMLEDAKDVMESSVKLQSNFFEDDDKNVKICLLRCKEAGYYLVTYRLKHLV
jgi:hypothetical protein